jgi:hypothetical protein
MPFLLGRKPSRFSNAGDEVPPSSRRNPSAGLGGEAVDGGLARYVGLLPFLDESLSHAFPSCTVATAALEEQFSASLHRAPESNVFRHPALGSPLDPSKLTTYARKALERADVGEGSARRIGSVTRR